eukprot:GHVN01011145.1.p1 GENE.GHVN01011145.1~~GHVN01011145.1.p1  ORF type:complete len:575 (+),score=202.86 GHVN01011145.1:71-1795(+)
MTTPSPLPLVPLGERLLTRSDITSAAAGWCLLTLPSRLTNELNPHSTQINKSVSQVTQPDIVSRAMAVLKLQAITSLKSAPPPLTDSSQWSSFLTELVSGVNSNSPHVCPATSLTHSSDSDKVALTSWRTLLTSGSPPNLTHSHSALSQDSAFTLLFTSGSPLTSAYLLSVCHLTHSLTHLTDISVGLVSDVCRLGASWVRKVTVGSGEKGSKVSLANVSWIIEDSKTHQVKQAGKGKDKIGGEVSGETKASQVSGETKASDVSADTKASEVGADTKASEVREVTIEPSTLSQMIHVNGSLWELNEVIDCVVWGEVSRDLTSYSSIPKDGQGDSTPQSKFTGSKVKLIQLYSTLTHYLISLTDVVQQLTLVIKNKPEAQLANKFLELAEYFRTAVNEFPPSLSHSSHSPHSSQSPHSPHSNQAMEWARQTIQALELCNQGLSTVMVGCDVIMKATGIQANHCGKGLQPFIPILQKSVSSFSDLIPGALSRKQLWQVEGVRGEQLSALLVRKNQATRTAKVAKGMQDYEPKRVVVRNQIIRAVTDVFNRYGAVEIDTPVMELRVSEVSDVSEIMR